VAGSAHQPPYHLLLLLQGSLQGNRTVVVAAYADVLQRVGIHTESRAAIPHTPADRVAAAAELAEESAAKLLLLLLHRCRLRCRTHHGYQGAEPSAAACRE
jgi:hypothetical protein